MPHLTYDEIIKHTSSHQYLSQTNMDTKPWFYYKGRTIGKASIDTDIMMTFAKQEITQNLRMGHSLDEQRSSCKCSLNDCIAIMDNDPESFVCQDFSDVNLCLTHGSQQILKAELQFMWNMNVSTLLILKDIQNDDNNGIKKLSKESSEFLNSFDMKGLEKRNKKVRKNLKNTCFGNALQDLDKALNTWAKKK
tara:strand:+ start:328 stop:906 length:579 start_codon:yes stop_codon:yes gene_type:complete